jgi:hypothetical protein
MKQVKLRIVSDDGVEATISTDPSQDGAEDYYAIVSVDDLIKDQTTYGIYPVQSFELGLTVFEDLTTGKRIGDDDPASATPSASWRIEVTED